MSDWANRCNESPEHIGSEHCFHTSKPPRGLKPNPAGDLICCWCGDYFLGDDTRRGTHGQYRPKLRLVDSSRRATRRRQQLARKRSSGKRK